ncbi:MAG: tyrosine-type recombinase/integrase [Thiobacillaceae bacterium]
MRLRSGAFAARLAKRASRNCSRPPSIPRYPRKPSLASPGFVIASTIEWCGAFDGIRFRQTSQSGHFQYRQSGRLYARIVHQWVAAVGLDSTAYGTHTMRRTKATLIYKRTKNLRAVQLLLGHSKLESTVRYLGIEVDDALEISEQTEI